MTTDLNTLVTAPYVKINDWLGRPRKVGRRPKLSDAELLTLAVAHVLPGVRSKTRWLRLVPRVLPGHSRTCRASPAPTNRYGRRYRC